MIFIFKSFNLIIFAFRINNKTLLTADNDQKKTDFANNSHTPLEEEAQTKAVVDSSN